MVDALRQIHRSLTPDGILLDVHPEPVNSRIEVWQGDQIDDLGEIDQHEDNQEIEDARSRLGLLIAESLFELEATDHFELREHHDSLESWQEKWAEEEYRLVADPELLTSVRDRLSTGGGEVVIKERVRASRYRRTAG